VVLILEAPVVLYPLLNKLQVSYKPIPLLQVPLAEMMRHVGGRFVGVES